MSERPHPGTWRPLVVYTTSGELISYEGLYEISHRGLVWSCRGGRLMAASAESTGQMLYCRAILWNGNRRRYRVGCLVLFTFAGPPGPGQECCHGEGGSLDNRWPENLRWDTHRENTLDIVRHGNNANTKRTHCPRDHVLAAPNLVPSSLVCDGGRDCLACSRGRAAIQRARKHGRPIPDLQEVSDKYYAAIMATARLD